MQYSHKAFSLITGLALAACASAPAYSQAAVWPRVVGVIDRAKVVTSYPKARQAADELKRSEERVHKLIEDNNKQYEDAKSAHKPPAELEGLQRRLQMQIDDEFKKVQSRSQILASQLETDIDRAIKAEAAIRKTDVVILKQAVLIGGIDITDGVIKRLSVLASTGAGKVVAK